MVGLARRGDEPTLDEALAMFPDLRFVRLRPTPGGTVIARDVTDVIKQELVPGADDGDFGQDLAVPVMTSPSSPAGFVPPCPCAGRPVWARVDNDSVMQWPVVELAEWEELRQCPGCGRHWLAAWPDEVGRGNNPL